MNEIVEAIDREIAKLKDVRAILAASPEAILDIQTTAKHRGRPKGSLNSLKADPKKSVKRVLSTEGKTRIAAAQRARWAEHKTINKRAAKKLAATKESATAFKKPSSAKKSATASKKPSSAAKKSTVAAAKAPTPPETTE